MIKKYVKCYQVSWYTPFIFLGQIIQRDLQSFFSAEQLWNNKKLKQRKKVIFASSNKKLVKTVAAFNGQAIFHWYFVKFLLTDVILNIFRRDPRITFWLIRRIIGTFEYLLDFVFRFSAVFFASTVITCNNGPFAAVLQVIF